jgi:hypothetical protein
MSVLPNVGFGQSVAGAGGLSGLEVSSESRNASIAGQSAALRASFQTAVTELSVAAA